MWPKLPKRNFANCFREVIFPKKTALATSSMRMAQSARTTSSRFGSTSTSALLTAKCGSVMPVVRLILMGDPLGGQVVPPVSAGKIKVRYGKWAITECGSTTAKLQRRESDEKYITKALGPKFTYDIEVL